MSVIVDGVLALPTEHRVSALNQQNIVTLVIRAGVGFQLEARLNFGNDASRAHAVAANAAKGRRVEVVADGCQPRMDHGRATVILLNVERASVEGVSIFP